MQGRGGVAIGNRERLFEQHVAGIQAHIHLHDGDAGLGIAGLDRPVDRRSPPPTREQGAVDIQAAIAGPSIGMRGSHVVEHPLGQYQPIGSHHHDIRLRVGNRRACQTGIVRILAVQAQAAWLGDRNLVFHRILLDRGGL